MQCGANVKTTINKLSIGKQSQDYLVRAYYDFVHVNESFVSISC